jgi:hypothetical protein
MKLTFVLGCGCALAWAQGGLESPVAGYLREPGGGYRAVYGVGGNFVLGPVVQEAPPAAEPQHRLESRGETIFVVRADGATLEILPPGATRALLVAAGLVYATDQELVLRREDRRELRWMLPGVTALRAMSAEYAQVSTANGEYALRLEPGLEALYRMPVAPPAERRR